MSALDRALQALYDSERSGGLGASAPYVARCWVISAATSLPRSWRVMQKEKTLSSA